MTHRRILGIVALGLSLLQPARAATGTPISGPTVITQPGQYYLTNDIHTPPGPSPSVAIEILTGNVLIDLNGFQVIGDNGDVIIETGFPSPTGSIRITNGSVLCPGGACIVLVINADRVRLDHLYLLTAGKPNTLVGGNRVLVEDNTIDGGDDTLTLTSDEAIVRRNLFTAVNHHAVIANPSGTVRVSDNTLYGPVHLPQATRSIVERNHFIKVDTGYVGITVSDNSRVAGNTIDLGQGCGIEAGSFNRILGNTVQNIDSSSGICILGNSNRVDGNISSFNWEYGIEFFPGATGNIYSNNTTIGNGAGGIQPGTGNIDGGGNVP
jgi:nitrous oxidase accessory protein NosD